MEIGGYAHIVRRLRAPEDRFSGDLPFKCWRCLPLAGRKKLKEFTDFLLEKEREEEAKKLQNNPCHP